MCDRLFVDLRRGTPASLSSFARLATPCEKTSLCALPLDILVPHKKFSLCRKTCFSLHSFNCLRRRCSLDRPTTAWCLSPEGLSRQSKQIRISLCSVDCLRRRCSLDRPTTASCLCRRILASLGTGCILAALGTLASRFARKSFLLAALGKKFSLRSED